MSITDREGPLVFTRFLQWPLSWARWNQSTILKFHLAKICFNIILHLTLTSVSFKWPLLSDFPSKFVLPTVLYGARRKAVGW